MDVKIRSSANFVAVIFDRLLEGGFQTSQAVSQQNGCLGRGVRHAQVMDGFSMLGVASLQVETALEH